MGKYGDHREQRRRRHDDPVSYSEPVSEPSYFQRPPTAIAKVFDADVIWFNASKGFGFAKLSDGTEVYLHIRALEAAGKCGVSEGTRLKVTVEDGPRGRQITQVLEIGEDVAIAPSDARPTEGAVSDLGAHLEAEGTVKWYNPEKGFGFISPANGDIFVHASALSRSGISVLIEGRQCSSNADRARWTCFEKVESSPMNDEELTNAKETIYEGI